MSEPRIHHFVTQSYQRGFARKKGKTHQVLVINRCTGKADPRNVRKNFAERDLNAIEDGNGRKDHTVEKLIATYIDDPAATALDDLRQERFPLAEPRRDALALFIAAQLTRGRWPRENVASFIEDSHRMMLRMAEAHNTDEDWINSIGKIPTAKEREQFRESERYFEIRPTNAYLLQTLIAPVAEVAEHIYDRTWTLVRFPTNWLLTAENPVVHITPSDGPHGYGTDTAERLYMPVSPRLGLVASFPWSTWPEAIVNGTEALAKRLNWAVLAYPTNDEVLAHPDTARHPLPGVGLLARGVRWPWGPDPDCDPPIWLGYRLRRREPNAM